MSIDNNIQGSILFLGILFILIGIPCIVSVLESVLLVEEIRRKDRNWAPAVDVIGVAAAVIGMLLLLDLSNVRAEYDWYQEIGSQFFYTPVANEHADTVKVFAAVSAAAPLLLNVCAKKALPPLVFVILIAAMYAGFAMDAAVTLQLSLSCSAAVGGAEVYRSPGFGFLSVSATQGLILFDILLMDIRTLLRTVRVFQERNPEKKAYDSRFLSFAQGILYRAALWPALALLLVLPVMGVLIAVLTLFGQAPDAAIRAFTETAEWQLSQMIPPQRVFYDEHYLCTVAAGGHKKIVKPLRKGIRHGHEVTVNRQLQIANAFEQILEERTPKFHRRVRGFYDRYGFPIARLIRTKTAADIVYILMKPLEWIFLIVLYLFDAEPENRIAMQYTGKSAKDITGMHTVKDQKP